MRCGCVGLIECYKPQVIQAHAVRYILVGHRLDKIDYAVLKPLAQKGVQPMNDYLKPCQMLSMMQHDG
jgi:hypothetical protein